MSELKINYLGTAPEADIGDRRMNSQWKLVPVEPTETMVINGFESEPNECFTDEEVWEQYQEMSGCQQAAFRAKLCWAAMLGAAPAATAIPAAWLDPNSIQQGEILSAQAKMNSDLLGQQDRALRFSVPLYAHPDAGDVARLTAERDALQQRLNAADQRIDDFAGGDCEWSQDDDGGTWNSACGSTWSFHDDGPAENGMHFCHSCGKTLVVEEPDAETEKDDDWRMNPCKQGHRDVGAAGGVAACNQCDEKIVAATTQEAFERWNATHAPQ